MSNTKQKLIDKYRDININNDWWEPVYDFFTEDMANLGIRVDEMYFRGFWSQGDGACFEGSVSDWPVFLAKHGTDNPVLADHAKKHFSFGCTHRHFYYHENSVSYDCDLPIPDSSSDIHFAEDYSPYPVDDLRTSAWLSVLNQYDSTKLEDEFQDIFRSHMQDLYSRLEDEYEHLTSDEAVWEAVVANCLDKEEEHENE
jgi:hypothetical protein